MFYRLSHMKFLIFNHFLPTKVEIYYYSTYNIYQKPKLGEVALDYVIEKEGRSCNLMQNKNKNKT